MAAMAVEQLGRRERKKKKKKKGFEKVPLDWTDESFEHQMN
jgi:hypothetical protein